MGTLNSLDSIAGGAGALGGYPLYFFSSRTHTFTAAGTVLITVISATASGAKSNNGGSGAATGSNSAPWGQLRIEVNAGDVLTVTIGAGGAAQSANNSNGNPGSNTTVALNGTTILTAQPGEPGVYHATAAVAAAATATVIGADFVVPGLRAGNATGYASSGGAAADVLRSGLGRSPNSTGNVSPGGSVGTDAGGPTVGYIAYTYFGMVPGDGRADNAPGRGGGGTAGVNSGGPFAGGAAAAPGGAGGIGGGGGASATGNSGPGAPGYVYATFTPSE